MSVMNPITSLAGMRAATAASKDDPTARKAAVEFEAMLLNQLTASMNKTSDDQEDGLFSSTGSDFYRQMFTEQIARVMAQKGGVGVADTIMRQIREKSAGSSEPGNGLDKAISAIQSIKEAAAPRAQDNRVTATEGDDYSTEMILPVEGRLTSDFGVRTDPINGRMKEHHGVDLAAPKGTPIGASADGTVIFSGRKGGYGNTVIIEQADGRQTLYGHADRLLVDVGEQVRAGQSIATVGSTGRSTGPHLHFEVRENGKPVDPLAAVTKDFVPNSR